MRKKTLFVVDSHTMGEPTRILVGGLPHIPGSSMAEKKEYLEEEKDDIRRIMMWEPRGHIGMFGSLITAPVNPEADIGVIFMDTGSYLNMCGHGSMGVATVALEMGILPREEPVTSITLDTPAGLVRGEVSVKEGQVEEVSIRNVPSFLFQRDLVVDFRGERIKTDISFGGNFFALVDIDQFEEELVMDDIEELVKMGMELRDAINEQFQVSHPLKPHIDSVDLVKFYHSFGPLHYRNLVIFGDRQFDRSPCGTGTSAKMAALYSRGELKLKEEVISESILKTAFKGQLLSEVDVGDYRAVIPLITGQAFITAISEFYVDDRDPLQPGFLP